MAGHHFWTTRIKEGAVLSPIDRISEVLFGLIMVMTITGTIRAMHPARDEARDLLWAALGCNVAWGIVDAAMYLLNVVLVRSYGVTVIGKIRQTEDSLEVRNILKAEIPPVLLSFMVDHEIDNIASRLKQVAEPPRKLWITGPDLLAAFQIFLLVFLCILPVVLPFKFISDMMMAVRVSNGIALLMLFIGGLRLGRYSGLRPGVTGLIYASIGVVLVLVTEALGG